MGYAGGGPDVAVLVQLHVLGAHGQDVPVEVEAGGVRHGAAVELLAGGHVLELEALHLANQGQDVVRATGEQPLAGLQRNGQLTGQGVESLAVQMDDKALAALVSRCS